MENIYNIWKSVSHNLEYMLATNIQNREARKDLLHDIFLKINEGIDSLNSSEKLLPWVRQITRNAIADHYRSMKRNIVVSEIPEISSSEHDAFNDRIVNCLMPMIEQLDTKYRDAILMSEIKGLKQKELASQLGISLSGVKSRVQRGRKKLREMILQCCEIEADIYGNILDYSKRKHGSNIC